MDEKVNDLKLLNPTKEINKSSLNPVDNFYSIDDENLIIKMKKAGYKDKEIAKKVNRSYSGITHKIMTLRKAKRL